VPEDEQAKPALEPDPGIVGGDTARVYKFAAARLTDPCSKTGKIRCAFHRIAQLCQPQKHHLDRSGLLAGKVKSNRPQQGQRE
jgi:hypothetical protein